MSDEGEESDSGERARRSESPSPPLSVCPPRGSPASPRPLDLFSSASPLLEDTDPPYLASSECLNASTDHRGPGDSPHFTPPKFRQRTGDSPFRSRQYLRIDPACDHHDDPVPTWRGRGAGNMERFQHRGQRRHRSPELPDYGNHHPVENIDTEFKSETRQT